MDNKALVFLLRCFDLFRSYDLPVFGVEFKRDMSNSNKKNKGKETPVQVLRVPGV
jgi:hypothetical protein